MTKKAQLHVRKLNKVGGTTYSVTLPIEMVRHLRWREGQKVSIELEGDQIVVRDWKKP